MLKVLLIALAIAFITLRPDYFATYGDWSLGAKVAAIALAYMLGGLLSGFIRVYAPKTRIHGLTSSLRYFSHDGKPCYALHTDYGSGRGEVYLHQEQRGSEGSHALVGPHAFVPVTIPAERCKFVTSESLASERGKLYEFKYAYDWSWLTALAPLKTEPEYELHLNSKDLQHRFWLPGR